MSDQGDEDKINGIINSFLFFGVVVIWMLVFLVGFAKGFGFIGRPAPQPVRLIEEAP